MYVGLLIFALPDVFCVQSYIGHVLISVNPFYDTGNCRDEYVEMYQGRSRIELPPHIFAIAEDGICCALSVFFLSPSAHGSAYSLTDRRSVLQDEDLQGTAVRNYFGRVWRWKDRGRKAYHAVHCGCVWKWCGG